MKKDKAKYNVKSRINTEIKTPLKHHNTNKELKNYWFLV